MELDELKLKVKCLGVWDRQSYYNSCVLALSLLDVDVAL